MANLQMPVGTDSFRKLRAKGQWYCDKTGSITQFLRSHADVTLFTRPRRFGKTLTMDTLAEFLDISKDSRDIFAGLDIMKDEDVCSQWMNKCPVVCLSLKEAEGLDFSVAMQRMKELLSDWVIDHSFLLSSPSVAESDKEYLQRLLDTYEEKLDLSPALFRFSRMLAAHYCRPSVILIDEYDVPVAKAERNGFYRPMLDFIRVFLGKALKSNKTLDFGVLTGCLRITKESIFTGLNNFRCYPLSHPEYADTFGFTKNEVDGLLEDAGLALKSNELRAWYDGYRFGIGTEIYCPWDVILYVDDQQRHPDMPPLCYWMNSSGNEIVQELIRRTTNDVTVREIEELLNYKCIQKELSDQLSYDGLYDNAQHLWSLLYQTGYLTRADKATMERCHYKERVGSTCLVIPNKEIRSIYISSVKAWFLESVKNMDRAPLLAAMWSGDAASMQSFLNKKLYKTISYYDEKEDYYHGFMTGIFMLTSYEVTSNREAGDGRPDVQVVDHANGRASIIEVKSTKDKGEDLKKLSLMGLAQIEEKKYAEGLPDEVTTVKKYGVAFYRKTCTVLGEHPEAKA